MGIMQIQIEERETYIEINIMRDEQKIGRAEVELSKKYLACFEIYEPFQNKGYGQNALKQLIEKYDIQYLSVKKDNARAIHVYEKAGFVIGDYGTFFAMKRESGDIQ